MMTLAQAMTLDAELMAMEPPAAVARIGKAIITLAASGGTPSRDHIAYVTSWIAKRGQQNRYGK